MIISVPISWNRFHRSDPCRSTRASSPVAVTGAVHTAAGCGLSSSASSLSAAPERGERDYDTFWYKHNKSPKAKKYSPTRWTCFCCVTRRKNTSLNTEHFKHTHYSRAMIYIYIYILDRRCLKLHQFTFRPLVYIWIWVIATVILQLLFSAAIRKKTTKFTTQFISLQLLFQAGKMF